jgi:hypothetical protein
LLDSVTTSSLDGAGWGRGYILSNNLALLAKDELEEMDTTDDAAEPCCEQSGRVMQ